MNPREIIKRFVAYSPLYIGDDGTSFCNFCSKEFAGHDDVRLSLDHHRDDCVWATAQRYLKETKMDDRDRGFLTEALETEDLFESTLDGIVGVRAMLAKEVGDLLAVCPQNRTLKEMRFARITDLAILDKAWKVVTTMKKRNARDR